MRTKKLFLLIGVAVLTIASMVGCNSASNATKKKGALAETKALQEFSAGYLPSTGHLLLFVAKEEGFFEEEGLNVSLVKFDTGTSMISAMEAGKLDAGAVGITGVLSYVQQGVEVSTIGGFMTEGHALVVKKEVVEGVDPKDYSLELLRGKRIASALNTTGDIIWREAFEQAGLEVGKDVELVSVESGTAAYTALNNANIDGASVYSPFRAMAVNEGYVILKYTGEVDGLSDHPCCRNVASNSAIETNPDLYKSYLKALIKAYKFYKQNEDKTVEDIVKYLNTDAEIIRQETYGVHTSTNPDPDKKSIIEFYKLMVKLGLLKEYDVETGINTEIYKAALDEIVAENPDDKFYADMIAHYNEFDA